MQYVRFKSRCYTKLVAEKFAPVNAHWLIPSCTVLFTLTRAGDPLISCHLILPARTQVSSQDARGNKEYRETPWVATDAALQAVDTELVAAPAPLSTAAPAVAGSVRRVGFSAAGMGMKVRYHVSHASRLYHGDRDTRGLLSTRLIDIRHGYEGKVPRELCVMLVS